jgi:hypothetical protein
MEYHKQKAGDPRSKSDKKMPRNRQSTRQTETDPISKDSEWELDSCDVPRSWESKGKWCKYQIQLAGNVTATSTATSREGRQSQSRRLHCRSSCHASSNFAFQTRSANSYRKARIVDRFEFRYQQIHSWVISQNRASTISLPIGFPWRNPSSGLNLHIPTHGFLIFLSCCLRTDHIHSHSQYATCFYRLHADLLHPFRLHDLNLRGSHNLFFQRRSFRHPCLRLGHSRRISLFFVKTSPSVLQLDSLTFSAIIIRSHYTSRRNTWMPSMAVQHNSNASIHPPAKRATVFSQWNSSKSQTEKAYIQW